MHQLCHPATRLQQPAKPFDRHLLAVLQRPEQGLRVRVVVTDRWPAARAGHTQALHRGEHRFTFHGRAVVRMHGELICRDALALADRLEQLAGQPPRSRSHTPAGQRSGG